jgi:hypothetical protein
MGVFGNRSHVVKWHSEIPPERADAKPSIQAGNPDPTFFKIQQFLSIGRYTAVRIRYPTCTNYQGMKILVYEATQEQVEKQRALDPHFSENAMFFSPVARFEPTDKGWGLARKFMEALTPTVWDQIVEE